MRRWLVLLVTLAATGLCVAATIVLVPCSGEQFALRLERSWI